MRYVNKKLSFGGRDEAFIDQGTDLKKTGTGRCAHRKASKLLILSDERLRSCSSKTDEVVCPKADSICVRTLAALEAHVGT